MNFNECMQYLDEINKKSGIIMGLEPMRLVLDYLNHPEESTKIIHIAGTNGKGSVSTFLAAILSEAGYRVGRYVSPTVDGYTERVQIQTSDGKQYITEEEVAGYISIIKDISDSEMKDTRPLTQFETETAMAYMAFRDWQCDYAVVECGMGGSDDATNAVDNKEMCIFTSISKDHMAVLGDDIRKIAANKAGILRNDVLAVSACQRSEVCEILNNAAEYNNTVIHYCVKAENCSYAPEGTGFVYGDEAYSIRLPGVYQPDNAAVAITAAKLLLEGNNELTHSVISTALNKAVWPGRFEIISDRPYIVIDGAHNVDGIKALVRSIDVLFGRDRFRRIGIMGIFADKDVDGMIGCIKDVFDEMHTITAPSSRGMNADVLGCRVREYGIDNVSVHREENCGKVLEYVCNNIDEEEYEDVVIVVFGSLSLYSDLV